MSKLVLIDGNAILHRAYHALPPLTDREGEPINAVYGFVSMLLRIITDLKPTDIAVAFDRKEPTFRKKEFKEYQAHRPKMEDELSSQFKKAREVIEAFNIPMYDKKGFEADDVIGTIAQKAQKKFDEIDIVTGDKDILQLVNGKVKVYLPIKGLSEGKLYGKKEVEEKMGVSPSQIVDYKALVGDPSDNYPGVKGIGPKTATKLLEKFKDFKNIYKNLNKIDERVADKLKDKKKLADMSYKLAQIVTNVPVKFEVKDFEKWNLRNSSIENTFTKFGFKTLKKRVNNLAKKLDEEKQMSLLN